ncbi:MAG TPA: hypothetical protein VNH46_09230, partial [Gemmatimonadales bacterium]|nr:hypothetical protein [Gemmatimonadales bacterium]
GPAGAPPPAAAAQPPFASGAAGGAAAIDLSSMTPKERFDRLYDRIMRAAESGDENTVTQFTPMALAAYGMLDSIDSDARYDAALLRLHTGDIDGAAALADTILKEQPGHLFGYIVEGTIARFRKDDAGLQQSYKAFLAHYDGEMKKGREEYKLHQTSLDDFRKTALAATGS